MKCRQRHQIKELNSSANRADVKLVAASLGVAPLHFESCLISPLNPALEEHVHPTPLQDPGQKFRHQLARTDALNVQQLSTPTPFQASLLQSGLWRTQNEGYRHISTESTASDGGDKQNVLFRPAQAANTDECLSLHGNKLNLPSLEESSHARRARKRAVHFHP